MLITIIQNSIPDKLEDMLELQSCLIRKLIDSNRIQSMHAEYTRTSSFVNNEDYLITEYVVNNSDDSHIVISDYPLIIRAFPKIRLLHEYFGTSPQFSDSAVQTIFDVFNRHHTPCDDMRMLVVSGELTDGFEACMATREFKCVAYQL